MALHEVRDPVHQFIRFDSQERQVIDSRPFARLRHVHQLSLSHFLYPGANHTRFEHSLGVMELAGRVYDVVTSHEDARRMFPDELGDADSRGYWRRVLRMAALCHDLGHLPFSHGAEEELLPSGTTHETWTKRIIEECLSDALRRLTPPLTAEHVIKVAVGPEKTDDEGSFDPWEAVLSEIIVGDAFGVDRMDYLLRDSHHLGVAYGMFDHYRLIDTLRILPRGDDPDGGADEPTLGVDAGGLHAAEAMMLARYFMYSQVYRHRVRQAFDLLLVDFLREWLPGGRFPNEPEGYLAMTDHHVMSAIVDAAFDEKIPGHGPARRIMARQHYRSLYESSAADLQRHPQPAEAVYEAACRRFGENAVRMTDPKPVRGDLDFPVRSRAGRIESSHCQGRSNFPPLRPVESSPTWAWRDALAWGAARTPARFFSRSR